MTIPQAGQLAPDFSLFSSDKNEMTLAQLRGAPVLLLFFPLAFTSVCTAELCAVRDSISSYNNARVQVLGISVDSVYTLAKYKEEQKLNFPLLSDFNKTVSAAYGSLYPQFGFGMKGVTKRAAFLIDEQGIIRYAEVLENANEQPNFQDIQTSIAQLGAKS